LKTQLLLPGTDTYALASEILENGGLVAFPTETVYGLGANALDRDAVLSIFAAKGRPADNPLIVHIYDRKQLEPLCEVPEQALPLMDSFWPGPLTILCHRKPAIPDQVTAGLPTVAVRMPSHPVARAMLQACSLPIAAPSANSSGRPSPTTAAHVMEDMDGKIPLIIDGGMCDVGVESTVLDLCHGSPVILRPGGITREMISSVLNCDVAVAGSVLRPLRKNEKALSPGMRYRHYAPRAVVTLVQGPEDRVVPLLQKLCLEQEAQGKKTCVLCFSEHINLLSACHPHDIGSSGSPAEIAHRLFDVLRRLDDEGMEMVFSEVVPPEGVGLAVMNRLGRAASFRTIQA
jgi:L-threonylcarbamoyladenylate synthase